MGSFVIKQLKSFDDSRLTVYSHLTANQLRSRLDPARAVVICETPLVVEVALKQGMTPYNLLTDTAHLETARRLLESIGWVCAGEDGGAVAVYEACVGIAACELSGDASVGGQSGALLEVTNASAPVPLFVLPSDELEKLTGYDVIRGLLAAMRRPAGLAVDEAITGARSIAVLENLVDVSNVGAIFRNAAALNVDAVLLAPRCADHLSRRAIRVSMGTVFQVPWAQVPEELWVDGLMQALHTEGFVATALALSDTAAPLTDIKCSASEKHALFFGSEGYGLDQHTIEACDRAAIIPMAHEVDSLNVAASSAVAFWELFARNHFARNQL